MSPGCCYNRPGRAQQRQIPAYWVKIMLKCISKVVLSYSAVTTSNNETTNNEKVSVHARTIGIAIIRRN